MKENKKVNNPRSTTEIVCTLILPKHGESLTASSSKTKERQRFFQLERKDRRKIPM